jgi:heavy metal sensor kinase
VTLSIRGRLTLWYATVLSLVLTASAIAFYFVHSRSLIAGVDEDLARAGDMLAQFMNSELEEGLDLPEAAIRALEDVEMPGRPVCYFDDHGLSLAGTWEGLPQLTGAGFGERGHATVGTSSGPVRVHWARRLHKEVHRETTYHVGVAESLVPVRQELERLRDALVGTFVFTLLLAVAGGWWIARGALRPVEAMAAQARRITDRTPGVRLVSPNPGDELGLLARAFNDLLARLEQALTQERLFMADASHELRTPVSISRTAIEVTLNRIGRPEDEYRDCLGVVAQQMRRLTRIVEDMFALARADVAGLPIDRNPLYVDEVVADCVKETGVLAAPKGVRLEWHGPSDLEARGDERLIRQMLVNLLHNAIRHTPSGGSVRVDLVGRPDAVEMAVTDSGCGIPEQEREHIFQRFVRLEGSRDPGEGAGLGLPIARAIAEAHGGTLVLARSDESGSTFLARLPLAANRA